MKKIVVIIILISVVAGIIWGVYEAGKTSGYNICQKESKDADEAAELKGKESVKEIIKWRTKEKKIYVDKIKYINAVKDTTGCADTKLTDMGFGLQ